MSFDLPAELFDPRAASLADEVYSALSQAIVDGTLQPGQRIRDVDLASHWGISRTPVREAIQRLSRQGLLEVAPHKYTRVTLPDEESARESLELMVVLTGASLLLGLGRMTEEEHQHAIELIDGVVRASLDLDDEGIITASTAFYTHVALSTRNRVLVSVMREAHLPAERFRQSWQPHDGDPEKRNASYDLLRAAIIRRDGAAAERILRAQHAMG